VRSFGFYTEGPPFEGDSLEKKALGGSETAFVEMTRALSKLGHEVTAFNNCEKPGVHEGVHYHPFRKSLPFLARKKFDVMVVSRFFGFFNLPVKANLKVLWNHDTLENPGSLRAIQDEIDLFLVLSVFHKNNYLTRIPQLDDRMIVTRNGLNLDLLDRASKDAKRDPDKLIYASRPERGLGLLLDEIFPRLKKQRPNLKLYLCGYELRRDLADPRLLPLYDRLDLLVERTPDVIPLGSLTKTEFYRHLAESGFMLYPCVFPEISCIVSLEAQALGTPILTSDAFALKESVGTDAFRVGGRPGSPEYVRDYVERALKLMANPGETGALAETAKKAVRALHSWDKIALEWQRIFELSLKAFENRKHPAKCQHDGTPKEPLAS
jgi:glycosyltransferase involved in cell wall biosynthesis